jgi:L-rhamnose mutarotase
MHLAFALDLIDDPVLIAEYERAHTAVWPEVLTHLQAQGILSMEIYRIGCRLFMRTEVDDAVYDPGAAARAAASDPVIQRWEALMWRYQAPTPWTPPGEKWVPMTALFDWQHSSRSPS